jgi:hypothetical protein
MRRVPLRVLETILQTPEGTRRERKYAIPLHIRNTIISLPGQFENDPYSYFLHIEQRANEYSSEKAFLQIEKLRNEFKDYPDTRARSKRGERYAIIAIGVSIVAIVLPFLCNKAEKRRRENGNRVEPLLKLRSANCV